MHVKRYTPFYKRIRLPIHEQRSEFQNFYLPLTSVELILSQRNEDKYREDSRGKLYNCTLQGT